MANSITEEEVAALAWSLVQKAPPTAVASLVLASFDPGSGTVAEYILDPAGKVPRELLDFLDCLRRAAAATVYPNLLPDLQQLQNLLEDPTVPFLGALHRTTVAVCKHWRSVPGEPLAKILFWCKPEWVYLVRFLLETNIEQGGGVLGDISKNVPKLQQALQAVRGWYCRPALAALVNPAQTKPPFYPPDHHTWAEVALELVHIVTTTLSANRKFSTQCYPCDWWDDRFQEYQSLHQQLLGIIERISVGDTPEFLLERWFHDAHHRYHCRTRDFLAAVKQVVEPLLSRPRRDPRASALARPVHVQGFKTTATWPWLYSRVRDFETMCPGAMDPVADT